MGIILILPRMYRCQGFLKTSARVKKWTGRFNVMAINTASRNAFP
jgi:hypothetical protein